MLNTLLNFLIAFALVMSTTSAADFYVSPLGSDGNAGTLTAPFQTITRARNAAQAVRAGMTSDTRVILRGGTYVLNSPILFDASHSGANGHDVVYQAYAGETPVISGGRSITGWTLHDPAKNIYKATVGTAVDSRQLYVNGLRAVRARSSDASGWSESGDGYTCPAAVASWGNIAAVEVVSQIEFKGHRGPIAAVVGTHAVMAQPYWANLHNQFNAPPTWVENAYELIDTAGEWYLNRATGVIYYKPRPGEDMASAEVIMPVLEKLVDASGLSHVQFTGLTFAYATWLRPNSPLGHTVEQADQLFVDQTDQNRFQVPGNLHFDACANLRFDSNILTHLGGTAVRLTKNSNANIFYNNELTDISGSGLSLGNLDLSDNAADTNDNVIDNNLFQRCGVEYESSVGILVGYTQRTRITHNDLIDLPYSGISMGWGWDKNKIAAKDCTIGYNKIVNILGVLKDGGGIYTLSNQPGTRIHNNFIKNAQHPSGGLYPDEGTSNSLWDLNVIDEPANKRWIMIWTSSITNVVAQNNYSNSTAQQNSGTNCTISNTTFVSGQNWPPAALAIIANAGRVNSTATQPPSCSPGDGTYATAQSVTLSSGTPGATIRYTTDGSAPSASSGTIYTTAITVNVSMTIKAIAFKSGLSDSPVISSPYTISLPPPNTAPVVHVGIDRAITLPAVVNLTATASDDGLPTPSALIHQWTTISGPGTVTFSAATALVSSADFSFAGTYVLRLTSNDGQLTGFDELTVTVSPPSATNVVTSMFYVLSGPVPDGATAVNVTVAGVVTVATIAPLTGSSRIWTARVDAPAGAMTAQIDVMAPDGSRKSRAFQLVR